MVSFLYRGNASWWSYASFQGSGCSAWPQSWIESCRWLILHYAFIALDSSIAACVLSQKNQVLLVSLLLGWGHPRLQVKHLSFTIGLGQFKLGLNPLFVLPLLLQVFALLFYSLQLFSKLERSLFLLNQLADVEVSVVAVGAELYSDLLVFLQELLVILVYLLGYVSDQIQFLLQFHFYFLKSALILSLFLVYFEPELLFELV